MRRFNFIILPPQAKKNSIFYIILTASLFSLGFLASYVTCQAETIETEIQTTIQETQKETAQDTFDPFLTIKNFFEKIGSKVSYLRDKAREAVQTVKNEADDSVEQVESDVRETVKDSIDEAKQDSKSYLKSLLQKLKDRARNFLYKMFNKGTGAVNELFEQKYKGDSLIER